MTDELSKINLNTHNQNNSNNQTSFNNGGIINLNSKLLKSEPTLSITLPTSESLPQPEILSYPSSTAIVPSIQSYTDNSPYSLSSFTIPINEFTNYHYANNILDKITHSNQENDHINPANQPKIESNDENKSIITDSMNNFKKTHSKQKIYQFSFFTSKQ